MVASPLPPAVALLGPTASGKTELALHLAKTLPLEIISVDSAQVFIDMDIGSAKPDQSILQQFPHHLVNIISPEHAYSAARFREDALGSMRTIYARDKIPLLVGGSMMYFKILFSGLAALPPADTNLRDSINAKAEQYGWPHLHEELARTDPDTARQIAPNDAQRIQRALEIMYLANKRRSELLSSQQQAEPSCDWLVLALLPNDRQALHQRIAQRFDSMLQQGLVDEVQNLRQNYHLDSNMPSMRCVGYRQVWDMLEGNLPQNELRDRSIFATRQFAKRQITWINGWFTQTLELNLFDCFADCSRIVDTAKRFLERRMQAGNNGGR